MSQEAVHRTILTGYDEGHRYIGIGPPVDSIDVLQGVQLEGDDNTELISVSVAESGLGPNYTELKFATSNPYDTETVRPLAGATQKALGSIGIRSSIKGRTKDLREEGSYLFVPHNNVEIRQLPEVPELEGVELPVPPTLWQDLDKVKRVTLGGDGDDEPLWFKAYEALKAGKITQEQVDRVMEYTNWIENHYMIDGRSQAATVKNIGTYDSRRVFFGDTAYQGDDHQLMLERFEFDYLGLGRREPAGDKPLGGTRWWASNAGFANGTYPTEAVARTMGMEATPFASLVIEQAGEYGNVVIRSDNYLIAVSKHRIDAEKVIITEIMELTEDGENAYKLLMRAYERGLEDAQSQQSS